MEIHIGPLVLTIKEALGASGVIFFAGGIWRDIRSMKRTLTRHGKYLVNDRDVLLKITTEHNKNHGANIQVPVATNGPAT